MKCRYCGHEIPEGMLYCEKCGEEVCIVPDYNPLDDMLTQQIRGAINGDDSYDDYLDYSAIRNTDPKRGNLAGRNAGRNTGRNTGRTSGRDTGRAYGRDTGRTSRSSGTASGKSTGRSAGRNTGNTSRNQAERDKRRRQIERKKALRRKRRRCVLLILLLIVLVAVGISVALYQTSYTGIVNKGNKALESKEYNAAIEYFEKAAGKDETKADAYTGLSKVYIAQNDLSKAETVFLNVIEKQPKNADVYEACVEFYMDTDQKAEIPLLLEDADDSVTEVLGGYIIEGPEFSLDDAEVFDDVQELSLSAKDGYTIYYTDDETEPTVHSTKYEEPIQIGEDVTTIKAIAVNKKGVPSLPVEKTYTVELPIEDAPAVSPSTGQYDSAMQIEIKVPDGYEAYYTTNGSDPTTASTKYTGPIDMPDGETIFKAILVNGKGRVSGVTTRSYVLETQ